MRSGGAGSGGAGVPQPVISLFSAPFPAYSRDELKRHYNLGEYWVEVEMEDLASFDEDLADYLYKQPAEHLQLLEEAAKEVADEVTRPRPSGEEVLQDIQVMLKSDASPSSIRSLK
ncbi:Hypothetical predicted protein, partial [Marmota monax]